MYLSHLMLTMRNPSCHFDRQPDWNSSGITMPIKRKSALAGRQQMSSEPALRIAVAGDLCRKTCFVKSHTRNRRIYEIFEADPALANIPVLEDNRIVGLINRDRFMRSMDRRFHWELYSDKRCSKMMEAAPLIVDAGMPIRDLAYGLLDISKPQRLSDGFVIVEDGKPVGMGLASDVVVAILLLERMTAEELRKHRDLLADIVDEHKRDLYIARCNAERQREENALAKGVIERITLRHGFNDERLRYWIQPADNFSGDTIASALSRQGVLYALLADATGHGLTAAISVVPILTLFYRLVELNRSIEQIARALNRELKATMPSERFVAASLLAYDQARGTMTIWQGGMPDILHLNAAGQCVARYASPQPPLGILDFDSAMAAVRCIPVTAGDQFVLFSDGLIEAENTLGTAFGIEPVEQAFRKGRHKEPLKALRHALHKHIGSRSLLDDVSVMRITCTGHPGMSVGE
jgi:predicted transcriptional regulator